MAGMACFPPGSRRGLEQARQRVRTAVSACIVGPQVLAHPCSKKADTPPGPVPSCQSFRAPCGWGFCLAGHAWAWWDYGQTVFRMPQTPRWLSSSGFAFAKPRVRENVPCPSP